MSTIEIHDLFGIKPLGEAQLEAIKAAIKGLSSFLEIVFKPGLEELGYMMKDEVRLWRLKNILQTLEKAQGKFEFDGTNINLTANARVGISIMEECSSVDNEELQDLWAGLFASSCTSDGKDDSNMNFVDLLRRMSSVEAKIIDYACKNCKKFIYPNKLIIADRISVPFETLVKIAGTDNVYRLDSELDHMRSIELLLSGGGITEGGGFEVSDNQLVANITPSPLALNLYYKTHAKDVSPADYWGKSLSPRNVIDDEKDSKERMDLIVSDVLNGIV